MRNYFANMIEPWALRDAFQEITTTFLSTLPELTNSTGYSYSNTNTVSITDFRFGGMIESFISAIAQIERMCFLDDPRTAHTFNAASYKPYEGRYSHLIERLSKEQFKTGFILIQAPGTKFVDSLNYNHLPAVENQFKVTPTHFLKIFTTEKGLVVYTNKDLPIDTIFKLKLLHWSMFKEKIKNPKPEIQEFLTALYEKNSEKADRAIDNLLKAKELQEIKYEDLKELFKPNFEIKLRQKEQDIQRMEEEYTRMENRLSQLIRDIEDRREELMVMENMADEEYDATPIIKHLIRHPYIKDFRKINSDTLEMYFESPLVYFDKYIIDRIIRNYSGEKKLILKAFKDEQYELMTRCKITFNTSTFHVNFSRIGNAQIIGHPHIDAVHCFGNHNTPIRDSAKEGDHLGAIEQISQATLNINFSDGIVVRKMLDNLINHYNLRTWRSKETGIMLSTEEVLEEYRNEEA